MPVIDVTGEHKNEAYWIHAKGKSNVWYCSACGEKILYNPTRRTYRPVQKPDVSVVNRFCRGCGKRMTGSVKYADLF